MSTAIGKENLNKRQAILDQYESSIGLPINNAPGDSTELEDYLSMSRPQIEALDATTAIAISARLAQFAFYFQRAMNREIANKIWAESELSRVVCKEVLQYDQYTPNKVELVCRENSAAKELRQIVIFAKQRIARLDDIASQFRNLGYIISLVAKNRMGENK